MSSKGFWTLRYEDGTEEKFIDIRRKIGNRIIRAYLLDAILNSEKVDTMKASLRGPKGEFKDFAKFLILNASQDGLQFRILAETGVYENLRVVGTDSEEIANQDPDALEKQFCDALQNHVEWNASLTISVDSRIKPE